MWTKEFWKATAERMIRGAAIAIGAVWLGGDVVFDSFNVSTWTDVASMAVSGAFLSLVLSLSGGAFGSGDGPSFTGAETLDPTGPP